MAWILFYIESGLNNTPFSMIEDRARVRSLSYIKGEENKSTWTT